MKTNKERCLAINEKLITAKKFDKSFKVFGSASHKYILHKTLNEKYIIAFEKENNIFIPECFKSFLIYLGSAGVSYKNSGAGPYYGIYPLGINITELVEKKYLNNDCLLSPFMSNDEWTELNKKLNSDIDIDDIDFEIGKIFGGILPLGSQGCSFIHGLVLNGRYAGKVVNIDIDRQKPIFTADGDFLDWYERWLDNIINGNLLRKNPINYGYEINLTTASSG